MEADQLRLILLTLGATLVVAIYLWDRYKRSRGRLRPMSRRAYQRHQPRIHRPQEPMQQDDLPHMQATDDAMSVEPLQLTEEDTVLLDDDSELQTELEFSAVESGDYLHFNPDSDKDLPQMVVQIMVVRPDDPITGAEVEQAMQEVGLKMGEMDIYHQYDKTRTDQALFSVASMVEPGNFPVSDMQNFATPGLLLFTQLPGVRDGLMIYSDMLFTAERLVGILGGRLQDDSHSVLGKQTIEHTRDSILEHRRKVQIARRR